MSKPSPKARIHIRPEAELLLCCAGSYMDSAGAHRIRALLRENIEWAYLLRLAHLHGTEFLLYYRLCQSCPEAVPKAVLVQLQDHFRANAERNLVLTRELLTLLNLLEAQEIPAIPFKGPELAALVYGDFALRQFNDLDILIDKRNILKAEDLLISRGYRPRTPEIFGPRADAFPSVYSDTFVRDEDGIYVDLHWGILARSMHHLLLPIDLQRFWERRQPVSIAGTTVLTFSPEDLLLVLCVHGAKHQWEMLKWIYDVAELTRVHQGMDWGRVMEETGPMGCQRILALGLYLAKDLLGATYPEGVSHWLRYDPEVESLAAGVRTHLFSGNRYAPGGLEMLAFFMRVRERLRDKVRYSVFLARQPRVKERWLLPLPAFFSVLYYLLWPAWRLGKIVLRPFRKIDFDDFLYHYRVLPKVSRKKARGAT